MKDPRTLAAAIEADPVLPGGTQERFAGYGVMGLPFASGHYLGLRRWPASSIGAGYTSVWHRDPDGSWTMTADTTPERQCARYFGSALESAPQSAIGLEWTGPHSLVVTIEGVLRWSISLRSSWATRTLSGVGSMMPGALWRRDPVLDVLGKVAGPVLGIGHLALRGSLPNGQRFQTNPRLVWAVASSTAVLDGEDLGPLGPLPRQDRLGDFWLPQKGIFAIAEAYLDVYDPAKHAPATAS